MCPACPFGVLAFLLRCWLLSCDRSIALHRSASLVGRHISSMSAAAAASSVLRRGGAVIETILEKTGVVRVGVAKLSQKCSFPLQRGAVLPPGSLHVKFASFGDESLPAILLCPSMSNTPFPIDVPELGEKGWWTRVVGFGPDFGIRLDQFRVIVPSPLGSPFGSTSPLSLMPSPVSYTHLTLPTKRIV